ncbi:MAG: DUF1292 domain-containing protein [Christensenellaceae bacterium]|jgi:uncharacterized protein YrzB (UPF0473 family)|nr:DUF1292 domain-containing protein [Christensenellaceae bacterium]
MNDKNLLDFLLGDSDENIFLFDEDGASHEFEQLAVITHNDKKYAILHPISLPDDEAAIFELSVEGEEALRSVEDETLANEILKIYQEESEKNGGEE